MTLKTRTVEIADTSHPDESWMIQMARNLTDHTMASSATRST